MVVSKDNKRRRKETETPPPPLPTTTSTSSAAAQQSTAAAAAAANAAVESSPEMPKRTKVQAQRKFAQGQSAPTASSAYSAAAALSTGPSTSTESQPPIDILPNKCPKPQDFLTFLCFRGTSALPPHLDYLNQGKSKEPEPSTAPNGNSNKKNNNRSAAAAKKKRGRPAKAAKGAGASTGASVASAESKTRSENSADKANAATSATSNADKAKSDKTAAVEQSTTIPATTTKAAAAAAATTIAPPVLAGAVRKRAEVVTEGNRRGSGRRSGSAAQAMGTGKRRSRRSKGAGGGAGAASDNEDGEEDAENNDDEEDDDDDEYFSAHDVTSRNGDDAAAAAASPEMPAKASLKSQTSRKSETPSKESDTGKSTSNRRGRPAASKKTTEATAQQQQENTPTEAKVKEKAPVKRVRQRESPIFIPSPESSGRMTRQRAFFEPVKVPPHNDDEKNDNKKEEKVDKEEKEPEKAKEEEKPAVKPSPANKKEAAKETKEKINSSIYAKDVQKKHLENGGEGDNKKSLNVFDFSSDDEQPLAKAIKLKKGGKAASSTTTSPKKSSGAAARGRKSASKKSLPPAAQEEEKTEAEVATPTPAVEVPKRGGGGAKANKKKADESSANEKDQELAPPSPKKAAPAPAPPPPRQARKSKGKPEADGPPEPPARSVSPPAPQQRSQRPSRKTKEAAAIYMGIIGHKLQLADDEEDDLSLDSFPDIPNVKEMEKMENEIKKNAAQSGKLIVPEVTTGPTAVKHSRKPSSSPKPPTRTPPPLAAAAAVASSAAKPKEQTPPVENKKPTPPRRGRPPKQQGAKGSGGAQQPPPKREIEGMLVKKGSLAKIASSVQQQQQQANSESQAKAKAKSEHEKASNSEEEWDFLINEELNETKRKLEKSFSDSDDEPLAIKVPATVAVKEKEEPPVIAAMPPQDVSKLLCTPPKQIIVASATTPTSITPAATQPPAASTATTPTASAVPTPQLTMLPLTKLSAFGALPMPGSSNSISPPCYTNPMGLLKSPMEKKSPVPQSKILNVPATYALPGTSSAVGLPPFNKTSPYLPQASPHYHTPSPYVRPPPTPAHPFPGSSSGNKTPGGPGSTVAGSAGSPLKYQTPPTTYPPPIEAYQCPKINPNFLTPKYDRRTNNFPSPSPVKFDGVRSGPGVSGLTPLPTPLVSGSASIANPALTVKSSANSVLPPPPTLAPPTPLSNPSTSLTTLASSSQQHQVTAGSLNLTMSISTTTTTTSTVVPPPAPTSLPMPTAPSTSAAAAAAAVAASTPTPPPAHSGNGANASSSDPLKDEIGSILAANLMPSKEESGKIFGIASVSLAQSSGPDNTKCTLGKCGSIHKPVLGPVVPTEGYFGDQLSSKERRKAKVNMTHEQIQKWLIECSSNPDEIQDDLDDDYEDSLRTNQLTTPPPNARDDKESTSFSSSSKNTRELGKSESAWSAKGPSLKATPVVAAPGRKEEESKEVNDLVDYADKAAPVNLTQKAAAGASTTHDKAAATTAATTLTDKRTKDAGKNNATAAAAAARDNKNQQQLQQQPQMANKRGAAVPLPATPPPAKQNRKKNAAAGKTTTTTSSATAAGTPPSATPTANSTPSSSVGASKAGTMGSGSGSKAAATTPKRTPVYNQKGATKAAQGAEAKPTASQKKGGAAAVAPAGDSVYAFGKDEEPSSTSAQPTKSGNRRKNADSLVEPSPPPPVTAPPAVVPNALSERSPTKKRAAAAAAATAVQLTLSPTENCKQLKGSQEGFGTAKGKGGRGAKKQVTEPAPPPPPPPVAVKAAVATTTTEAESDAEGATFYIPLQGAGVGGSGDGGIQGVAVKLGREGPDGPNQKVVMQATLVTKAQMDTNSKPLPDSLNTNELVKTLLSATANSEAGASGKKSVGGSASNSLKSVPIATAAPAGAAVSGAQSKGKDQAASTSAAATTTTTTNTSLVRVNSNSSLFSGSAKSRPPNQATSSAIMVAALAKKYKDDTPIKMANNTAFPRHDDPTQMVEAPIFRPTEKEFADPIEFIERITPIAARFGICKIIPPATFKPECRISDEMRFTAYNQYVHKMLHRWGPSAKELSAIKKYLATQSIVMNHPPWIGGMEVDLPRLYHTVQELGGLKEVIEKKKWARVAEEMCIPKLAQDRVTKLDDIYCKYLLPYDTLSPAERQKLFDEVEADWAKREARARRNADRFVNTESVSNEEDDVSSDEDEESEEEIDGVSMECIVKGRSMPLSQFYRIARNTMALWFKNADPIVNEVEAEFWRHVAVRDSHVCVHSGSIDSSGWGYGFPSPGPKGKGSNYARHPWNLKVLTNNPSSVLRSLGPVMGVTVPTLHVGMLFSACCWYRDPHGLSWIEYLHTGASKLWYGIPDDQSANFRAALTSLIPTHCQNKTIWLPCDTVMVPPHMLTDRGVSLCRIEQKPGEFIVVFPRAYTSSLATGYVVSESVYFATMSWLDMAKDDFRDIHESCEPAMFSLEQLLFALGYDQRVTSDTLQQMLPMLNEVCEKESAAREQLRAAGVTSAEKVQAEKGQKAKKQQQPPYKTIESECDLCRANLYISMVRTEDGNIYCLQHALKNLNNGNIQAKQCKLIYAYNVDDIQSLIRSLQEKITQKQRQQVATVKKK